MSYSVILNNNAVLVGLMVERFGYSLDVGKSLENEDKGAENASAKASGEESKEEVHVEQESPSVSDNGQANSEEPANNSSDENNGKGEETHNSEDLGEPIVDDSDEEVTGEMLSARKMKKDILDEIKDDVEGVSEASGTVRADNDLEDLEDDKEVFNPTSDEAYAEERPAEAVESEHIADRVQEEGVLGEGSEESSYVSEEKPLTPEEADVKDMVDESFRENNEAGAILEEDQQQTFGLWKWGVGIIILLVLTFVVVKFGFIGPVDNSPTAAVPGDSEFVDLGEEGLVTDVIPSSEELEVPSGPAEEIPVEETPPAEAVPDSSDLVVTKDYFTVDSTNAPQKEKDPEQLLSILKEGLN
jgi:hypothetical protein